MSTFICNNDTRDASNIPFQVFEIYLQRDDFFPGEIISGKLLVLTDRKVETEGIYLKFEGKGGAKWGKRKSYLWELREAEYVKGKKTIFVNVFRYDEHVIPEGSSALPFEFEMPHGIPPTILPGNVMKQMKISYSIEALIKTSNADYRQVKKIVVKGLLNLNSFPELSLPICKTIREILFDSCWSSSGNAVVFSFSIPKQGFVPGEKLVADLLVKSFSPHTEGYKKAISVLLSTVELCLIQEIEVTIGENRKLRRRILAKNDVMHISTKMYENKRKLLQRKIGFGMKIPEDLMITYDNQWKEQDFVVIRYFLRIAMGRPSFPYKLTKFQLPIKIGTVWIQAQRGIPILLLASAPLALPFPKLPKNFSTSNRAENEEEVNQSILSQKFEVTLLPKILLNLETDTQDLHSCSIEIALDLNSQTLPEAPKNPSIKAENTSLNLQEEQDENEFAKPGIEIKQL